MDQSHFKYDPSEPMGIHETRAVRILGMMDGCRQRQVHTRIKKHENWPEAS
jgi:hypothetical protein